MFGNNQHMTTLPVSPMLLHSTDVPPASPGWVHQVKFDGIRCVLAYVDGAINLWSRHGTPCTRQFPELQSLRLPQSVILDGELIVVSSGWTDFEAVMEQFMSHKEHKIARPFRRIRHPQHQWRQRHVSTLA